MSGSPRFNEVGGGQWKITYISEEGARLAGYSLDELKIERIWEQFLERLTIDSKRD